MSNEIFINFFTPQKRVEQDALLGFTLSSLPAPSATGSAMQLRLIRGLWQSDITSLEVRFVTTPDQNLKITIYLLFRIRRPQHIDRRMFQSFCVAAAARIVQLCKDCGYQLQPITSEDVLIRGAFAPFPIQALAEVRRREEIKVVSDPFTEYEIYVPYAWEWTTTAPLISFEALAQHHIPGLVSIYLEPTQLLEHEQDRLMLATSENQRRLLLSAGPQGEAIYKQYQHYLQRLQNPYLLRICLAVPVQRQLEQLGQIIMDQALHSEIAPILQFPQSRWEWQTAMYNLRYLESIPWGNISEETSATARLRYLVDSQGASMGFHLPVAQEQQVKVLILFANPKHDLDLEVNERIIREAIERCRYRENISLTIRHAPTIHSLRRALLDGQYQIVHFAGHGNKEGLVFAHEDGSYRCVPHEALAELFHEYSTKIECVVLNACDSHIQAQSIVSKISYAIAMEGPLSDRAALEFSRGFYDSLGARMEIEAAYREGCLNAKLTGSGKANEKNEPFAPRIFKRPEV